MSLKNEHVKYFERRGLNRATVEAMNIRSVGSSELCSLVNRGGLCSLNISGVQMPALDINGDTTDNYSIFAINENTAKPFFRIGVEPHLYIPQGVPKLIEEDNLLIITVNEIVAVIAAQNDLPCIAIQGPYKWNNFKNIAPLNGMDGVKSDKELKQDSTINHFTSLLPELQKLINELKPKDIVVIGNSNLKADSAILERRGLEVLVEAIKIHAPYKANAILTFCPELNDSDNTIVYPFVKTSFN